MWTHQQTQHREQITEAGRSPGIMVLSLIAYTSVLWVLLFIFSESIITEFSIKAHLS